VDASCPSFGLTAAFAIAVSLLVSFTLTPMLQFPVHQGASAETDRKSHVSSKQSPFFRPIDRAYTAMLRWSMAHRGLMVLASGSGYSEHYSGFRVYRKKLPSRGRPFGVSGKLTAPEGFRDLPRP